MATVRELLDRLHAGDTGIEDVARAFRERAWPQQPAAPTKAELWGVADAPGPTPDSWAAVEADSRLTGEQYQLLADAYSQAPRR
jgi:hypothetical protein